MKPIRNFLSDSIRRSNIGKHLEASSVVQIAQEVVNRLLGEQADKAQVRSYFAENLNIVCQNSAIANEIVLHEHEILKHLADRIPEAPVRRIKTRLNLKREL
ncbi:MAG: DciA family protein [Candidatus Uhrbacteria bacterium]|nr:DUF721 domain-containing protein [Patescibacteria group bacterium]MBU1906699.1 DUF721 domain-containing protein [Patescibacteria group bacterium]